MQVYLQDFMPLMQQLTAQAQLREAERFLVDEVGFEELNQGVKGKALFADSTRRYRLDWRLTKRGSGLIPCAVQKEQPDRQTEALKTW